MLRTILKLVFFFVAAATAINAQTHVIVDADTGNEVDDLFALAHILMSEEVNVTALNAAHWQTSHWTVPQSMENSHRLNQQLLGEMGLNVKTRRGGLARMYDWGDRARHSAASYEIIHQAKQVAGDEKLPIVVLGALTNVASAVTIDPSISDKIKIYWLGTTVDFEKGILKRNDFNCLMDPYALDYLLDSNIEMNIIPINVAEQMQITQQEVADQISKYPLGTFLMNRWYHHIDSGRASRVLWDLALVAAFVDPDLATTQIVTTSKDSGNRPITFYKTIDAKAIYASFYKRLTRFSEK